MRAVMERRWTEELFRWQNEQDLVMGWMWEEEGDSQGGLPGNGFGQWVNGSSIHYSQAAEGKMGGGGREAARSVRSQWEIQTLGMWVWSFLEIRGSSPIGSHPAAHFLVM